MGLPPALGWIDHYDYYGPITDAKMLEVPKYLTAAVVLHQSDEAFEHAVRGWSRFGTPGLVEAVYAYIQQARRGVIDRGGLLQKLLTILPRANEGDILALQRVLKLGLGITTCDLGLVVLSYVPVRDGPPPRQPPGLIYELRGIDSFIYIARNNDGRPVYDVETMCVVPASSRAPHHPLYEAYLKGFRIPSEADLCVVHKKLRLKCIDISLL